MPAASGPTRAARLRRERAPFAKGVLAFNVFFRPFAYAGAAFARIDRSNRDTRGIASSAEIDERWSALVLAPAVFDAWRYFRPRRSGRCAPRAAKVEWCSSQVEARRSGGVSRVARSERERHRAFDDDFAVDARDAVQHAHPAAQPLHDRLDDDDVAGCTGRR